MPGGISPARSAGARAPSKRAGQAATVRGKAKAPAAEAEPLLSLDTKLDLIGGVLIIVALINILTFLSSQPGMLARIWLRFIYQTFGWGAYIVPLAIGAVGVWLIWRHFGDQLPPIDPVRIIGAGILFVGGLTLMHAVASLFQPVGPVWINPALADPATPGYTPTLVWEQAIACPTRPQELIDGGWVEVQATLGSYDIARCGNGGGFIGAFIQVTLQSLIGDAAVFVIAATAIVVGLMIATRTTLKEALDYVSKGVKQIRGRQAAPAPSTGATAVTAAEPDKEKKPRGRGRASAAVASATAAAPTEEEKKPTTPVPPGRPSVVDGRVATGSQPGGPGAPAPAAGPGAAAPAAAAPVTAGSPAQAASAAPPGPGPSAGPPSAAPPSPQTETPPGGPAPAGGRPPARAGTPPPAAGETQPTVPLPRPGSGPGLPGAPAGGRPSGLPGKPGGQTGPRPGGRPADTSETEAEAAPSDRAPGRPGASAGQRSRPAAAPAEEDESDSDEDNPSPGTGSGGASSLPRPGLPPRRDRPEPGGRTSSAAGEPGKQAPPPRPGAGRTFGPPPPASIGGPRPAPKPAPATAPGTTGRNEDDILFDDLSSGLDDLRSTFEQDPDEPPADRMIRDPVEEDADRDIADSNRPGNPGSAAAGNPSNTSTSAKPPGNPRSGNPGPNPGGNPSGAGPTGEPARRAIAHGPAVVSMPAPVTASSVPAAKSVTPSVAAKPPQPAKPDAAPKKDGGAVWNLPAIGEILNASAGRPVTDEELRRRAAIIEQTLASFGAPGRVVEINPGPVITQFGVEPDYIDGRAGKRVKVKVGKISALADDLALALAAPSIRVEAPVPGRGYVGIEVPNAEPSIVSLREVMDTPEFRDLKSPLKLALGQNVSGEPVVADLTSMPHLLIAGTTGSGKSVCVNGIICTMLMTCTPDELKMIMVDPKRVELTNYNGVPHLMAPVVTELERIVGVLKWVQREMDDRYRRFAMAGARNITDYNNRIEKGQIDGERLPFIIVVVDELADLMMLAPDETERVVTRLAQMARATGIHIIISTQRPSVDVVTGLIKANFPARIAFAVATGVDSRVILDMPGAEKLLGRGDMLFQAPDAPMPLRLQGVYVSDEEIERIVEFWRAQAGKMPSRPAALSFTVPDSGDSGGRGPTGGAVTDTRRAALPGSSTEDEESDVDDLFDEAVELVRGMGKASISLLQRHMRIGYTRAARLIDLMEERGVIGPHEGGSRPRVVLDEDGNPLAGNMDNEDEEEG